MQFSTLFIAAATVAVTLASPVPVEKRTGDVCSAGSSLHCCNGGLQSGGLLGGLLGLGCLQILVACASLPWGDSSSWDLGRCLRGTKERSRDKKKGRLGNRLVYLCGERVLDPQIIRSYLGARHLCQYDVHIFNQSTSWAYDEDANSLGPLPALDLGIVRYCQL
ncbi:hypothetical protein BDZ91DRAFT_782495 [Kalaharituber pfeilii]|nr:hypothetical protein BDZ91DRAFT_782495 [Kalaharituber pfeilii]